MRIIDLMGKIDFKKFKWNEDQQYESSGFYPFEAPLPLCYKKVDDSNCCKGSLVLQENYENECEDCIHYGGNK